MGELALAVAGHYPDLDSDLILVGVLFHDLGKLLELGAMPINDYTKPGRLVGHIVMGRDLLRERCAAIDGFPEDLQLHLEHLVLSHHGELEFGSPVLPMTPEAFALAFIDNLDSKLAQLRQAARAEGGMLYMRSLGRFVLLPDNPDRRERPATRQAATSPNRLASSSDTTRRQESGSRFLPGSLPSKSGFRGKSR